MRPSRPFLRLLTLLNCICGIVLLCLALHLVLLLQVKASAAVLMIWLSCCVVLLSILGFIGAGQATSCLLLLYFYINFLLLSGLFVSCYAAFFFHNVLESWMKRQWVTDVFNALRNQTCCVTYSDTVQYLEHRVMLIGSVEVVCMVLIIASMYCVVRIVTVPIIMRSMLSVTNVIFMLLGTGLFGLGLSINVHDEMTAGQRWIAILFIVVGTLMVALSVLGTIASKAKSRSLLFIYMIGLGSCLLALMVYLISVYFSFSDNLASTYNAHTSSTLACDIGLPGCTNCTDVVSEMTRCEGVMHTYDNYWVSCNSTAISNASISTDNDCSEDMTVLNAKSDQGYTPNDIAKCGKCPEWSASDVQAYLQSTRHLLGLFALVVCLFVIIGFAGALVLRRSLAGYLTDSI
ncbi:unnamed protein product [Peronospora effusa]|nr:unnamed protein product [Peronospora effusa]